MVEVFKDQQRTVLIGNFVDLFSCGKFGNEQVIHIHSVAQRVWFFELIIRIMGV